MKAAIITSTVGAPRILASTSLISGLADGLVRSGIQTRVLGLTLDADSWRPESLGALEASAPLLQEREPLPADRVGAARRGIPNDTTCSERVAGVGQYDWLQELRVQVELEELAGDDPDLTVMVYPRSYPMLSLAARITRRRGWRLFVFATETPSDVEMGVSAREAYIRCVVEFADGVLAVSDYLAQHWIGEGIPPNRVEVIPSPVSTEHFPTSCQNVRPGEAVYFGNVEHAQIDYLLDVAAIVSDRVEAFHLTVYGDALHSRLEEWRAEVMRRSLGGVVAIHDPVSPTNLPALLCAAEVLLVPPRDRGNCTTGGFPMKLTECLASGRPVVATLMGDIPRYLADGKSAYLVEPADHLGFAEAVIEALGDPARASEVGRAGRLVAEQVLDSRAVGEQVLRFIAGLPRPVARWTMLRAWWAGLAQTAAEAWDATSVAIERFARAITHTRSGHTRIMAAKIAIVEVLRRLHLKPPAP